MSLPWFSLHTNLRTKPLCVVSSDYFNTTKEQCNASSLMEYVSSISIEKHLDYLLTQMSDPIRWVQGNDLFLLHASIRLLERAPHMNVVALRWKLGPYWLMFVRQSESDWDAYDQMATHMSLTNQALTLMQTPHHPRTHKYLSLMDRHVEELSYDALWAMHRIQNGWCIPELSTATQTLLFNAMWRSACDRVRLQKEYPRYSTSQQQTLDSLPHAAKMNGFSIHDFKTLKKLNTIEPAMINAFSRMNVPRHVESLRQTHPYA